MAFILLFGKEPGAIHIHIECPPGTAIGAILSISTPNSFNNSPGSAIREASNFTASDRDRQRHALPPMVLVETVPIISHPLLPFWYNPIEPESSKAPEVLTMRCHRKQDGTISLPGYSKLYRDYRFRLPCSPRSGIF
jgi:hypothetical protein